MHRVCFGRILLSLLDERGGHNRKPIGQKHSNFRQTLWLMTFLRGFGRGGRVN
jgi:hypothetical protein